MVSFCLDASAGKGYTNSLYLRIQTIRLSTKWESGSFNFNGPWKFFLNDQGIKKQNEEDYGFGGKDKEDVNMGIRVLQVD